MSFVAERTFPLNSEHQIHDPQPKKGIEFLGTPLDRQSEKVEAVFKESSFTEQPQRDKKWQPTLVDIPSGDEKEDLASAQEGEKWVRPRELLIGSDTKELVYWFSPGSKISPPNSSPILDLKDQPCSARHFLWDKEDKTEAGSSEQAEAGHALFKKIEAYYQDYYDKVGDGGGGEISDSGVLHLLSLMSLDYLVE